MFLCITNRKICREDLGSRIEKLCRCKEIEKIILREKDLSLQEYEQLARRCSRICQVNNKPLVINSFIEAAYHFNFEEIQVSFKSMKVNTAKLQKFSSIGVSVHSVEEAVEAESLGADYLIAGHIFPTECKSGIPGRGLLFLNKICRQVTLPVYAIGGITKENISLVVLAGARGGCMMSGYM